MTPQEALDWCEQFTDNLVNVNVDTKRRTLGLQAMQTCKSAVAKQIPKEVEYTSLTAYKFSWVCPKCKTKHVNEWCGTNRHLPFCSVCGQAIDWSDTK